MTHPIVDVSAAEAGLDPAALERLGARIQAAIDDGRHFGASVLVARGGVVGYRRTLGTVAPGREAAADDVYLMMSLSKAFTAALVLRAIDQGRFTLDTRVAEILPAFAAGGKQRATIRHLLTHTAGTFSGIVPPAPASLAEMGDLQKMVQVVSAAPAAFRPGTQSVYNTFGSYAVLGGVLVATDPAGRSFRDIAREDLFEPLGMADTSFGLATDAPRRVPVSFTEANTTPATPMVENLQNNVFDETAEVPAGGAFSTIDDVFRFTEALRRGGTGGGHRLLSPALLDYARRNHTGDLVNGAWDFAREAKGLGDAPANFTLLGGYVRGEGHVLSGFGHTASPSAFCAVGGGSTYWMVDPERDLTFVFLSAGFIEGLDHMIRLQQLSDLALASAV